MDDPRYVNRGFGLKQAVSGALVRDYDSELVRRIREGGFELRAGDVTFRLPREFGFCYGVDRAIEYAYETRERFPERRVFLTGEIVHNPGVNRRLEALGILFLDGRRDEMGFHVLGPDDVVILPAFGVPVNDMARLRSTGAILVDTTCGSVLNVWKNVERYARDGFTALIHGKHDHEETKATASRAIRFDGGHYVVVRDLEETERVCASIEGRGDREAFLTRFAAAISPGFDPDVHLERIGCANQTTMLSSESLAVASRVRRALTARWGENEASRRFRNFDTICGATQERQDALETLLRDRSIDVLLVLGGYNSSNTAHLVEIGLERGVPTFHVDHAGCFESPGRLRHQRLHERVESVTEDWLPEGPVAIGVTAGASTPAGEIERALRRIASFRGVALD